MTKLRSSVVISGRQEVRHFSGMLTNQKFVIPGSRFGDREIAITSTSGESRIFE